MARFEELTVMIVTKGRRDKIKKCVESIDYPCKISIVADSFSDVPESVMVKKNVTTYVDKKMTPVAGQNMLASLSSGHLLPTSDDVEYLPGSIASAINTLKTKFRFFGVVGFNQVNIPDGSKYAFTLIGRPYYSKFGLYHPDYMHFYADTELGETAIRGGYFIWDENAKLIHHHPAITGVVDETHKNKRGEKLSHDSGLYQRRVEELANGGILH
jgi:hypothetical protein